MIGTVLTALASLSCFLAALFMVAGLHVGPTVTKGRKAGRCLASVGLVFLGVRLLYLLLMGAADRINLISLVAIFFIGMGTAAIWADIVDHDEERK